MADRYWPKNGVNQVALPSLKPGLSTGPGVQGRLLVRSEAS